MSQAIRYEKCFTKDTESTSTASQTDLLADDVKFRKLSLRRKTTPQKARYLGEGLDYFENISSSRTNSNGTYRADL